MRTSGKKDAAAIRRENLKLLLAQWGGPTVLARKLQHSGPSYLVQLVSGTRPLSEKAARKIELSLDLPNGWMDGSHGDGEESAEILAAAMAAVEAELARTGTVPAHQRQLADLYLLVYEQAKQSGIVNTDYVARLVRLISK